jgi:glutamate/aspartate transport system substrate-binding protein
MAAGLGPVQVEIVPLSPANRMAMIENGTADMECDLTTETAGRNDAVNFLDTIYYGKTELAVPVSSPITGIGGLKGKRVIAVTGSSNIQAANDMDSEGHLGITIIPARDTPEGFRMLTAGGADAMVSSDVLLRTMIAQSGHAGEYRTFDSGLGTRKYGIMVRQGNDTFRDAAIRGLHDVMQSGQFKTLYDRWFTSPIPPNNINLDMPMSADLVRKVSGAE